MNDFNPAGWRPSLGIVGETTAPASVSGNRALALEEPLIFEIGHSDRSGVDFDDVELDMLATLPRRTAPVDLPGLSEPETVRHYTRLSRQNYAIDLGLFPLGSCTMKHNPRLNEKVARMPGFAAVHPLQPQSTVRGALTVIAELADWLVQLTGMSAVAMSPKAGAHGELCGLMAIHAALEARGEAQTRRVILVPESAHGTNPATAAFAGFAVAVIPAGGDGRVDLAALLARLGPDVAGVMITNPNTCGLFERDMKVIADAVHAAGGYVYCDGANFNAIVGRVRPGDLGVDAMHINLHKTFSTPHGGGGPGSGPVVLSAALADYAPRPHVVRDAEDRACTRSARCVWPDVRFSWPDGHVYACPGLYPDTRRRWFATGVGRCGAQCQLRAGPIARCARRAVCGERTVHARGPVQRSRVCSRVFDARSGQRTDR